MDSAAADRFAADWMSASNQRGGLVNEVLVFDGDLVRQGSGTYPEAT